MSEQKSTREAGGPEALDSRRWPELRSLLADTGLSSVATAFVAPLRERDDLPERLANMARMFRTRGDRGDAVVLARAARRLGGDAARVRILTEWLDRRAAPLWHFDIVRDETRNAMYAEALRQHVTPGMNVLEIGTGSGILAMLAARAGARHVYTCERSPEVAEAARAVIARNGFAERVTVIARDALDVRVGVDLPERADLLVAEIVDSALLGEQALPLTEHARRHLLRDDAVLLPRGIGAYGALVAAPEHRQRYRMTSAMGFDLTPFNRFSPSAISLRAELGAVDRLSEPCELIAFDLGEDAAPSADRRIELIATRDGVVDAVVRWLRLDFGAGLAYENRPFRVSTEASAWAPQLHFLPEPRPVRAGDVVSMALYHNRYELVLSPAS